MKKNLDKFHAAKMKAAKAKSVKMIKEVSLPVCMPPPARPAPLTCLVALAPVPQAPTPGITAPRHAGPLPLPLQRSAALHLARLSRGVLVWRAVPHGEVWVTVGGHQVLKHFMQAEPSTEAGPSRLPLYRTLCTMPLPPLSNPSHSPNSSHIYIYIYIYIYM